MTLIAPWVPDSNCHRLEKYFVSIYHVQAEATKTGQTNSSLFPVMLSAQEWRQMCRKIIKTHWVNQILQQREHK